MEIFWTPAVRIPTMGVVSSGEGDVLLAGEVLCPGVPYARRGEAAYEVCL